jgi:hypothetical protein
MSWSVLLADPKLKQKIRVAEEEDLYLMKIRQRNEAKENEGNNG